METGSVLHMENEHQNTHTFFHYLKIRYIFMEIEIAKQILRYKKYYQKKHISS